jgi:sn-glycerol 3-phosphate transport system substrate-binding protein
MTKRPARSHATHAGRRVAALLLVVTVAACAGSDNSADVEPELDPTTAPEADATTPPSTDVTITATIVTTADDTTASTEPTAPRCAPADASNPPATTIAIWHSLDGDVLGFFDEVIAEFESEHPGIDVVSTRYEGGYTAGLEQLATLDEADRPDVFMGSNSSIRVQHDSGLFVPPSECTDGETPDALRDLLPIIERTHTVDGTLVAAPYNVSTPVMMYDRKLWRAAGVDPDDPPATFDELEVVIRRLRDSGAATTGMVLYDRAASWLVEQSAAQDGRLLVEPANGREGTAVTSVEFDTPETVANLERFRVLSREGYILWAGINQSGRDDLLQLVSPDEPSGLTLHTSASIGDVVRVVESGLIGGDVEVGAAPLPGNTPGGLAGGGSWWLLEHDNPARVGAAWTLVDWLIQPDRLAELAAFTGYVPTTERAVASEVTAASWEEIPALRVGYEQLAAMPDTDAAAGMQVGPMVEVQRALEVAASVAIEADQDPAEQLRLAEGTALTALDAYDAIYGSGD